jgi:hypothetical protein
MDPTDLELEPDPRQDAPGPLPEVDVPFDIPVDVDVDRDRPSTSRVYDYFLGGTHNFAADRALAARLSASLPDIGAVMRENRAFLRRAVRFLTGAGIRQFLDLGSGIPNVSNVHEIAQRCDAAARIVYVDLDPTAVAASRVVLAGNPRAAVVHADLRDIAAILAHPQTRRLLDPDQPTAVLLLGVLHDIPDSDDPWGIIARIREHLQPGSFIALSQGVQGSRRDVRGAAEQTYNDGYAAGASRLALRARPATLALFDGFDLVEPGLVYLEDWRPEPSEPLMTGSDGHRATLCGIGMR